MEDDKSYIYLFDKSKFYVLNRQGRTFLAPIDSGIRERIIPSTHMLPEHRENISRTCNLHNKIDMYILCPYYSHGDYQMLVTGKSIKGIDKSIIDGVYREIEEETGLIAHTIFSRHNIYGAYTLDIMGADIATISGNKDLYGDYANMTHREFKTYEQRNILQKINVTIFGKLDQFMNMYGQYKIVRPKFAEQDIIGFLLIPIKNIKNNIFI